MLLLMSLLDSLHVQSFLLPQSALCLAKGIVWSQFTPGACIQLGSHVPLCSQGRHPCFGRRVPWKSIIRMSNTLLEQAERDLMSSHIHPTAGHVPAVFSSWDLVWAQCALCLLPFFLWGTQNTCDFYGGFAGIPAGSWCSCGALQDGLNGCCPLSSLSCSGVPVSPVQCWHHFPAWLCCTSPEQCWPERSPVPARCVSEALQPFPC